MEYDVSEMANVLMGHVIIINVQCTYDNLA